jgi:hypothetical protein
MKNQTGKGGRCQELALAAALTMVDQTDETSMVLLAAGSDGIDGPTDAAGAYAFRGMIVTDEEKARARTALEEHDAYTYFSETPDKANLLKVGHTNTNVMDVVERFVKERTVTFQYLVDVHHFVCSLRLIVHLVRNRSIPFNRSMIKIYPLSSFGCSSVMTP